jgi:cell fate (sporulation/competence/biofilm development) regulator YlbF (YheA/YmcA/DUF963 family)
MHIQTENLPPPQAVEMTATQTAEKLGKILNAAPEFQGFLATLKRVNQDVDVQRLSSEIQARQRAFQWSADTDGAHTRELAQLEQEFESLPVILEYRRVEKEARQLFQAVDAIVSREAGVTFAQNAQRSSCGCGG